MALALLSPAGRRLPRFGGAEELCRRDDLWAVFRVEGTPCQEGDVFPGPFPVVRSPPNTWAKHRCLRFAEPVTQPTQPGFSALGGCWPHGRRVTCREEMRCGGL